MANNNNSKNDEIKQNQILTRELLEEWLPVFKDGLKAKAELSKNGGNLSRQERVTLRKRVRLGEQAYSELLEPIMKLASNVIKREISRPRSFHLVLDEESLYSVAREGIYLALQRIELDKLGSSNVNLILQYINTKVSREALKQESAYGLPSARLLLFRKIAAVRQALTNKMNAEPTDEEVLAYFKSGKADWKTVNGRKGSNNQPFKANQKITLEDIKEQHEVNDGQKFKFPITDELAINRALDENNILYEEKSVEDEIDAKAFWQAYFNMLELSQLDRWCVAKTLMLYPVKETPLSVNITQKYMSKITREFINRAKQPKSDLRTFAKNYETKHGTGFWSLFVQK